MSQMKIGDRSLFQTAFANYPLSDSWRVKTLASSTAGFKPLSRITLCLTSASHAGSSYACSGFKPLSRITLCLTSSLRPVMVSVGVKFQTAFANYPLSDFFTICTDGSGIDAFQTAFANYPLSDGSMGWGPGTSVFKFQTAFANYPLSDQCRWPLMANRAN